MHKRILSIWLNSHEVVGHAVRAEVLVRVVGAVLSGGRLSLTHLGRNLSGRAHEKHQIKTVDHRRLVRLPARSRVRHVEGRITNWRPRNLDLRARLSVSRWLRRSA